MASSEDEDEAEVEGIIVKDPQVVSQGGAGRISQMQHKPRSMPRPIRKGVDVFGSVDKPGGRSPSKRRAAQKPAIMYDAPQPFGEEMPSTELNGHKVTSKSSRKRRRKTADSVHSDEEQENYEPVPPARAPSPAHSQISVSDVKNRRKRIRR